MQNSKTHMKPQEIADSLGVGVDTVLRWINSEILKASNIAMTRNRPRWRVSKDDLQAFLDARSNQVTATKAATKRPSKPTRQYV